MQGNLKHKTKIVPETMSKPSTTTSSSEKVVLDANSNEKSGDIEPSFPSLVSHWMPPSQDPMSSSTSMITHWPSHFTASHPLKLQGQLHLQEQD